MSARSLFRIKLFWTTPSNSLLETLNVCCKTFPIQYIKTYLYYQRSNRQEERFIDAFKTSLKTNGAETKDILSQRFLRVYWVTPNLNTVYLPTEIMFTKKIRSVFDKLPPDENVRKQRKRNQEKNPIH